jgi:hypothetical protein
MTVNRDECEKAGISLKDIERISKGLSRYGRQAEKLGITIFGGSGTGTLRIHDANEVEGRALVLANIDGDYDGGDGSEREDEDGLIRGE